MEHVGPSRDQRAGGAVNPVRSPFASGERAVGEDHDVFAGARHPSKRAKPLMSLGVAEVVVGHCHNGDRTKSTRGLFFKMVEVLKSCLVVRKAVVGNCKWPKGGPEWTAN